MFNGLTTEQRTDKLINWVEEYQNKQLKSTLKLKDYDLAKELEKIQTIYLNYCYYTIKDWDVDDSFVESGLEWLYFNLHKTIIEMTDNLKKLPTAQDYLKEFFNYLYYSSDRMNQNRMLRCSILLDAAYDVATDSLSKGQKEKLSVECHHTEKLLNHKWFLEDFDENAKA